MVEAGVTGQAGDDPASGWLLLADAVFDQTDADGDGTISRAEFRAATHGLHPLQHAMATVVAGGRDADGGRSDLTLRTLFDFYDTDHSGTLDAAELCELVKTVYCIQLCTARSAIAPRDHRSPQDLLDLAEAKWVVESRLIMERGDRDRDGRLDFGEFAHAASHMPVLVLGASLLLGETALSPPPRRETVPANGLVAKISPDLKLGLSLVGGGTLAARVTGVSRQAGSWPARYIEYEIEFQNLETSVRPGPSRLTVQCSASVQPVL
jgi:Ca2+-binding EF-hand superfamily protein